MRFLLKNKKYAKTRHIYPCYIRYLVVKKDWLLFVSRYM